jgi:hypothetical protein
MWWYIFKNQKNGDVKYQLRGLGDDLYSSWLLTIQYIYIYLQIYTSYLLSRNIYTLIFLFFYNLIIFI